MSVQSEIDRINGNVASTYSALEEMGATMPEQQNSNNMAATVMTVPRGGTQVQTDWNQKDETAADFLRNKPFGETTTIFADEQTVVFEDGMGFIILNESADIGSNVTVMWDGVPYNCVAFELNGMPAVGEIGYIDGEVISGEPFLIALSADSPVAFPVDFEKTDAVVQIYGEKVNKLDGKYVPDDFCMFYAGDNNFLYNDPDLSDMTTRLDILTARRHKFAIVKEFETSEVFLYPNRVIDSYFGYAVVQIMTDGNTSDFYTAEYTG